MHANVLFLFVCLSFKAPGNVLGQNPFDIRLTDGLSDGLSEERDGRVEIFFNDRWGTICDDGWDQQDSGVICRMLGYNGASRAHPGGFFPPGNESLELWLDTVDCDGNEKSIVDCRHDPWGTSNCDHSEDAGVTCLGLVQSTTTTTTRRPTTTTAPPTICEDPKTDLVRLVDDELGRDWVGRVQVFYDDTWWEVCDDSWGINDAKVICTMLCYHPDNARAHLGTAFGNITGEFLLDNVRCLGTEESIFDCGANAYGDHDCTYKEGAGVSCMPDEPPPIPIPDPEIVCEDEKITAKFSRTPDRRLRPEHLSLFGLETCGYTTDMDGNDVSISIPFIGCGTTREINDTHIIYDNMLRYDVPPGAPDITREQVFNIPVICVMGRNDDPDNGVEPLGHTVPPQYGHGHFEVDMNIYESNRFRDPIQSFPAPVQLGEWVYVGLSLTTTDQQLKIVVPRCYTTPELDPQSTPQYFLIQDKCKVEPSVVFYPINDTMLAFRFRSFKFIGDYPLLYVHCKAYVCGLDEKDQRCDRTCAYGAGRRHKRDLSALAESGNYEIVFPNHTIFNMERGPVIFIDPASTTATKFTTSGVLLNSTDTGSGSSASVSDVISRSSTPQPLKIPNGEELFKPPPNFQGPAIGASPEGARLAIGMALMLLLTLILHI